VKWCEREENERDIQYMAAFSISNVTSELLSSLPNEDGAREFLSALDWPRGLQDIFIRNIKKIPIRFFVCDDSGSVSIKI
jgi:hypothetical protein